jgi:L-ascorbate metabolism protein UlaG (beta-lactamase superfamily)
MDIQFYGANCIALASKQARVIIDDNLAELGASPISKAEDVTLFTMAHGNTAKSSKIVIDHPGEYEVSGTFIYGIKARAHMDEEGKKTATMFKIIMDDIRVLITGHIYPDLTDDQLEEIGMVDIIFVPVGGNGYTLDGIGALKLIKKVEPKLIIPTHYDDSGIKFPVPQQPLEQALKSMAMEPKDTVNKLRIKPGDLVESMQLVVLNKS